MNLGYIYGVLKKIFTILGFFIGCAVAHPHVFIDAKVDMVFNAQEFVGVQNRWEFDLIYSQAMIAAADANNDGKFDSNELKLYEEQIIDAAKEYSRFNYIGDGSHFYSPKEAKNIHASISAEGKLVVEFLNTFHIPSNPNDYTMLVLAVTDPTNYILITVDMEKSEINAPDAMDVEYFVDALDGLTLFQNFSNRVKGLYVRYQKAE